MKNTIRGANMPKKAKKKIVVEKEYLLNRLDEEYALLRDYVRSGRVFRNNPNREDKIQSTKIKAAVGTILKYLDTTREAIKSIISKDSGRQSLVVTDIDVFCTVVRKTLTNFAGEVRYASTNVSYKNIEAYLAELLDKEGRRIRALPAYVPKEYQPVQMEEEPLQSTFHVSNVEQPSIDDFSASMIDSTDEDLDEEELDPGSLEVVEHVRTEEYALLMKSHLLMSLHMQVKSAISSGEVLHAFSFMQYQAIKILVDLQIGILNELALHKNPVTPSEFNALFSEGLVANVHELTKRKSWQSMQEAGGELFRKVGETFMSYMQLEGETFNGKYDGEFVNATSDEILSLITEQRQAYLDSDQPFPWQSDAEVQELEILSDQGKSPSEIADELNEKFHVRMPLRTTEEIVEMLTTLAKIRDDEKYTELSDTTVIEEDGLLENEEREEEVLQEFTPDLRQVHALLKEMYKSVLQQRASIETHPISDEIQKLEFILGKTEDHETNAVTYKHMVSIIETEARLNARSVEIVNTVAQVQKLMKYAQDLDVRSLTYEDLQPYKDLVKSEQLMKQLHNDIHLFHHLSKNTDVFKELIASREDLSNQVANFDHIVRKTFYGISTEGLYTDADRQQLHLADSNTRDKLYEQQKLIEVAMTLFSKYRLLSEKLITKLNVSSEDPWNAAFKIIEAYKVILMKLESRMDFSQKPKAEVVVSLESPAPAKQHVVLPKKNTPKKTERTFRTLQELAEVLPPKEKQLVEEVDLDLHVVDGEIQMSERIHTLFLHTFGIHNRTDFAKIVMTLDLPGGKKLAINRLQYFLLTVMQERVDDGRSTYSFGLTARQLSSIARTIFGNILEPYELARLTDSLNSILYVVPENQLQDAPVTAINSVKMPVLRWGKAQAHNTVAQGKVTTFFRTTAFWYENGVQLEVMHDHIPYIPKEVRQAIRWYLVNEQRLVNERRMYQ